MIAWVSFCCVFLLDAAARDHEARAGLPCVERRTFLPLLFPSSFFGSLCTGCFMGRCRGSYRVSGTNGPASGIDRCRGIKRHQETSRVVDACRPRAAHARPAGPETGRGGNENGTDEAGAANGQPRGQVRLARPKGPSMAVMAAARSSARCRLVTAKAGTRWTPLAAAARLAPMRVHQRRATAAGGRWRLHGIVVVHHVDRCVAVQENAGGTQDGGRRGSAQEHKKDDNASPPRLAYHLSVFLVRLLPFPLSAQQAQAGTPAQQVGKNEAKGATCLFFSFGDTRSAGCAHGRPFVRPFFLLPAYSMADLLCHHTL